MDDRQGMDKIFVLVHGNRTRSLCRLCENHSQYLKENSTGLFLHRLGTEARSIFIHFIIFMLFFGQCIGLSITKGLVGISPFFNLQLLIYAWIFLAIYLIWIIRRIIYAFEKSTIYEITEIFLEAVDSGDV